MGWRGKKKEKNKKKEKRKEKKKKENKREKKKKAKEEEAGAADRAVHRTDSAPPRFCTPAAGLRLGTQQARRQGRNTFTCL